MSKVVLAEHAMWTVVLVPAGVKVCEATLRRFGVHLVLLR